jgi:hypothetical protein
MFYNQEQAHSEPETPFDLFFTLTFLLHFYSNAFVALLIGLGIDLAWVATAITTRLVDWAVESLCNVISEGVLAIRCRLHRERPTEAIARRAPALALWLLFLAFNLLSDWFTLGWSFFVRFPLPVLLAFVLMTTIGAWLAIRLSALHCGAWETAQLLAKVEQMYAETRAEAEQTYQEIEQCACGGEE